LVVPVVFASTARPTVSTLSLHDALPICRRGAVAFCDEFCSLIQHLPGANGEADRQPAAVNIAEIALEQFADRERLFVGRTVRLRSEEHTSELQSLAYLVCRLLLEKKKWI